MQQTRVRQEFTTGTGAQDGGVFICRPSQICHYASDAAYEMTNRRFNKMLRRASGPYIVLSVQPHIATFEEDGIPNIASIDHLTLSRTQEHVTDNADEMKPITIPRHGTLNGQIAVKEAKKATTNDITVAQEHIFRCTKRHSYTPQGRRYDMVRDVIPFNHYSTYSRIVFGDTGMD